MHPPTRGWVTEDSCCKARPAGRLRALAASKHWLSSRAAKHMAKVVLVMRAIPTWQAMCVREPGREP